MDGTDVSKTIRWEDYVTHYDSLPQNAPRHAEQYETGRRMAREGQTIFIAVNSVWSSQKPGCFTSSYEKLGYHSCTADLIRGWVDGGATIIDYRDAADKMPCFVAIHDIVEAKDTAGEVWRRFEWCGEHDQSPICFACGQREQMYGQQASAAHWWEHQSSGRKVHVDCVRVVRA
jgi:hypothetical protein